MAFPRSVATYNKHRGGVFDMCSIENSHSLASASGDGSIHVWRVEMASSSPYNGIGSAGSSGSGGGLGGGLQGADANDYGFSRNSSVSGTSLVKMVNPDEGAVVSVQHYNGDVCSVLAYATQHGGIHGWDLRASQEAFNLNLRPELGYPTSMCLSPDRHWICAGTSRGMICLWDVRFNTLCNVWQHSSRSAIHRLACCRGLPKSNPHIAATEGAYLFVAAGQNEAAVWGLPEAGECLKCFRSVSLESSRDRIAPLPVLRELPVPRHMHAPIHGAFDRNSRLRAGSSESGGGLDSHHSVRAILGRVSNSLSSYVITAGTDRCIRYWDFASPSSCCTITGSEITQPRAIYDAPKVCFIMRVVLVLV
jgi:phosphoinositide-3-kinase regulatory subunit 4